MIVKPLKNFWITYYFNEQKMDSNFIYVYRKYKKMSKRWRSDYIFELELDECVLVVNDGKRFYGGNIYFQLDYDVMTGFYASEKFVNLVYDNKLEIALIQFTSPLFYSLDVERDEHSIGYYFRSEYISLIVLYPKTE